MKARIFVTCLIVLWLTSTALQGQDVANDLLGRINTLRGQLGLAPYTLNAALTSAAQNHAQWMVTTQQVSHVQADGSRPRDRAVAAGYNSSWVTENIYMGGLATANDAWHFWLNSSIHYAGLTSSNYQHIGIASAQGAGGQAFVLVFGVPGGVASNSPASNTTTNNASDNNAAPSQPSYVVGVDSVGNIMHQVQPGDTLGDILLSYGYNWDDLPTLLELNEMTETDIRALEVDSILLVPPKSGTYTPQAPTEITAEMTEIPSNTATTTAQPTIANGLIPPATYIAASSTPTASPRPLPTQTTTQSMVIRMLPTATQEGDTPLPDTQPSSFNRPPAWLIAAIIVQVGILAFASIEFLRRLR